MNYADEKVATNQTDTDNSPWKIFIVDDDQAVHDVTTLVLSDVTFENKKLTFLHAYTTDEAKEIIRANPDIATIILDVIMEKDDSGLTFIKFVREELNNKLVRIILRTGQPGMAPERKVINNYDINDYKEKTELTSDKLNTAIITSLRAYKEIRDSKQEQLKIKRDAQRSLQQKDDYIKLIADALPVLISFIDKNELIQFYNKTHEIWFHGTDHKLEGAKIAKLLGEKAYTVFKSNWNQARLRQPVNFDMELQHYQQGIRMTNVTLVPYIFEDDFKGCFTLITDITERKQIEQNLHYLANHDVLTGLYNRSYFNMYLTQALKFAQETQKAFAVVFLDIDDFKKINDTLGHEFGDLLLTSVSSRLKECLRGSDIVARFGGDEFTIFLRDVFTPEDIVPIANKIITALTTSFQISKKEFAISGSLGISVYPNDGTTADVLLKNADLAMYHAKKNGKNAYQFYNTELDKLAVDRFNLEKDLKVALTKNELEVYYQPIIDLNTGKISTVEALIRWHHPTRGLLQPKDFVPLCEENGAIIALTEWVLKNTCKELQGLHQLGFKQLKVSVNISPAHFIRPDFVDFVADILQSTGFAAHCLLLELTENILISNFDSTYNNIDKLKVLGVSILLDDFGTGFSSLSYLSRLAIDGIKIDESFSRLITEDLRSAAIISAITHLMRSLGIKTIVEAIENKEQLNFVYSCNCDMVQGFLLAKPMPLDALKTFLSKPLNIVEAYNLKSIARS